MRDRLANLMNWLVHAPAATGGGSASERLVRYLFFLGRYGWRNLRQDRAAQMAAALSFRTFFALIPVLIVATVLVKALRGEEMFRGIVSWTLDSLGVRDIELTQETAAGATEQRSLDTIVESMVEAATSFRLDVIGWIGAAIIIYAAIGLMVTIENSFNQICRAPSGRSWTRRVPLYFFVLVNGPVAIALTQYVDNRVGGWIASVPAWHWVLNLANLAWNFCFAWVFILLVYRLVPNVALSMRAALGGAFVTAVLLMGGKSLLAVYFSNAFTINVVYGSLGLIPVLMFWVYVMWLVVLFGLEVAVAIQMVDTHRMEDLETRRAPTGLVDPAGIVHLMQHVLERFQQGQPATAPEAAAAVSLPEPLVEVMLERLVREGLLHRVEGSVGAYALALPPEQAPADRLLRIGFALVDEGQTSQPGAIIGRLREAQLREAAGVTLTIPRPS